MLIYFKSLIGAVVALLLMATAHAAQPNKYAQSLKNIDAALKQQKKAWDDHAKAEKELADAQYSAELAQWSLTLPKDTIMNYALSHGDTVNSYFTMADGVAKHDKDAERDWESLLIRLRYDMSMQSAEQMKYGY